MSFFIFQKSFPVQLRVIIDHDETTVLENGDIECNTMIVRQYEIEFECREVTILANGDITYNPISTGVPAVTLNSKSEGTVVKFSKIQRPIGITVPKMYDNLRHPHINYKKDKYGKIQDCTVPLKSIKVSSWIQAEAEAGKFWDLDKKMVQNSFICSQVNNFFSIFLASVTYVLSHRNW